MILGRRKTQKLSESNDFPSLPCGQQNRDSEPKEAGSVAEERRQHAGFDKQRWLEFIGHDARGKSDAKDLKRVLLRSKY